MNFLELLAVILIVMWVGGLALDIAGGLIHLLLISAVLLFVVRLLQPRTA